MLVSSSTHSKSPRLLDQGLAWILYEPWLIYLQFVISTVFLFDYIRELLFVPIRHDLR